MISKQCVPPFLQKGRPAGVFSTAGAVCRCQYAFWGGGRRGFPREGWSGERRRPVRSRNRQGRPVGRSRSCRNRNHKLVQSWVEFSSDGMKTSQNGPRNLLSGDQSVIAKTTSENAPLNSVSSASRKSTAVRWGSFAKAPHPRHRTPQQSNRTPGRLPAPGRSVSATGPRLPVARLTVRTVPHR